MSTTKILLMDDSLKHRKACIAAFADDSSVELVAVADYMEAVLRVQRGERFDVALLDLLMPAEPETLGASGLKFIGQSIPVGYPLAVKLALLGIPKVAVVTDTGHHDHPASAMMDWFRWESFRINESTVLFTHAPLLSDDAKDWKMILQMF